MRPTGPGQPVHLLLDVTEVFTRLKIPYAVVGALAASFHGLERSTNDADVTVWFQGTSLLRDDLFRELRCAGFQAEMRVGAPDDPIAAVIAIKDTFGNQVDLLIGVRGMSPEAPSRAISSRILGSHINIIGLEDFIAMKIFAGGHKDLEDIKGVLQVSGDKLDLPLLKKLTRRYGALEASKLGPLLKKFLKPT